MKSHTYENGFRFIYEQTAKQTEQVSVQIICDIGSIHEPPECRGAAHFIEHMCFKGTERLKNTEIISTIFDKSGAFVNAYTDRRYTCYYVSGIVSHAEEYINTLSDMVLNSVFKKSEYVKEHDVVREEMTKDQDDAETLVYDNADKELYAGTPYADPVDHIKYHKGRTSLQYENVLDIYHKFYVPSRFILSICSSLSYATVKAYVDKCILATSNRENPKPISPLVLSLAPQNGVVYKLEKKMGISATHLCIGFRTCSLSNMPDKCALKILKNILSGTMNARLFFKLREENGLTYTSGAYTDYAEMGGNFKIYAECDSTKVFHNGSKPGVFPLLIEIIEDLIKRGITDSELRLVKGAIKGRMLLKKEDPGIIAEKNGTQLLYGTSPFVVYSDIFRTYIEPITKKQVNDCIRKYLKPETMVISVVSSNKDVLTQGNYEKYVRTIKWSM